MGLADLKGIGSLSMVSPSARPGGSDPCGRAVQGSGAAVGPYRASQPAGSRTWSLASTAAQLLCLQQLPRPGQVQSRG